MLWMLGPFYDIPGSYLGKVENCLIRCQNQKLRLKQFGIITHACRIGILFLEIVHRFSVCLVKISWWIPTAVLRITDHFLICGHQKVLEVFKTGAETHESFLQRFVHDKVQ